VLRLAEDPGRRVDSTSGRGPTASFLNDLTGEAWSEPATSNVAAAQPLQKLKQRRRMVASMDRTDTDLLGILAKHHVTVARCDGIPAEWHPLLNEALTRLKACGWTQGRLRQVKEKFGTLRIYVDTDGESPQFCKWAHLVTVEVRERSGGQ
jgi:hypothetical protein